ncbi:NUDIX hydrolase [Streptomyces sp. NPDC002519]
MLAPPHWGFFVGHAFRCDGRWWVALPGGGRDIGETIGDTVVREVREEAGIEVEVAGLSGIYTDPGHDMRYDDGEVRRQLSPCFRARPVGGRTSSEATQVRWADPADLEGLDVHPTRRLRSEHALDGGRGASSIG